MTGETFNSYEQCVRTIEATPTSGFFREDNTTRTPALRLWMSHTKKHSPSPQPATTRLHGLDARRRMVACHNSIQFVLKFMQWCMAQQYGVCYTHHRPPSLSLNQYKLPITRPLAFRFEKAPPIVFPCNKPRSSSFSSVQTPAQRREDIGPFAALLSFRPFAGRLYSYQTLRML